MSEHIDDVSRNFCPLRRYGRGSALPMLLVTIALALPAFAVGFMWGPAMGAGVGLTAGKADKADGERPTAPAAAKDAHDNDQAWSPQPHGHAAWDQRPVRAAADHPLAEIRFLPPGEQLAMVDALPRGDALSAEQAQGLRQVVADREVIDVVRNNAANRLIHRADDGELWQFFAAIHDDPEEGPVWRDYSLQFLSMTVSFADDPTAAMEVLARVASEAPQEFAGTALLHLARLGDAGVEVPPGLVEAVISERLQYDDTPDALRHTCLALIGDGGRRDLLPLARHELGRDHAGVEALRGALYSVGRLGTPEDRAAVEAFLAHDHPGVVRAAEAAMKRLQVAEAEPSRAQPAPAEDQS